jgi:antitoxin HicB
MQTLSYKAYIERHPDGFLVRFYDVPGALTQGDTLEEAIANAPDALEAGLEAHLTIKGFVPARSDVDPASAAAGVTIVDVAVPPAIAARAILADAMRKRGLSGRELAGIMGKDEKLVRRILGGQEARLERTLDALAAIGIRPGLAI